MKLGIRFGLALLWQVALGWCWTTGHAADADLRLLCLSLKFQPAVAVKSDTYRLEITLGPTSAPANGELGYSPTQNSQYTHITSYLYYDPSFPDPFTGTLYAAVPASSDDNDDGLADFYETEGGVTNQTTQGFYTDGLNSGTVQMTWNRAAGSRLGTCQVLFDFQPDVTFTNTFELLELHGKLSYSRSATSLVSQITLTNTADPSLVVTAPLSLTRSNVITVSLAAGSWTNSLGQTVSYQAWNAISLYTTDYLGLFIFNDYDPSTSYADYLPWIILITDPNDADKNGIPDLTDDPPLPPRLALIMSGKFPALRITGTVGQSCEIQQSDSLRSPNWTPVTTVKLSESPQQVSLPGPTHATAFYRVKVQ